MVRRQKEPRSTQRLHAPFPFTPEEVRRIQNGIMTTLEVGYRESGGVSDSHRLHNAELVIRALRSIQGGTPNKVVKRPVLNDLFAAAWAGFRNSQQRGRDDAAARRAAAMLVQMHLEFHLGILEHVTVGEYRDDA